MDLHNNKTENKDKAIYENVLRFPQDTDYVKYFEKIPHPDKIDAALLGILEAWPKENLNGNMLRRQLEFESLKRYLEPKLSTMDKRLLLLPSVFESMRNGTDDENYRKALAHLRDSFYNYFTTPIDGKTMPDIQWIDYAFAVKDYDLAQKTLHDLKLNLFNMKATENLEAKLRNVGAFGNEKREFYFWNTDPHNWSDISYQSRSVKHSWDNFKLKFSKFIFPPQYKALGDFNINALPEGYVEPKGKGIYEICVNKVYLFVNDSFNFEGDQLAGILNLPLKEDGIFFDWINIKPLYNADFQAFQRHGYGAYFPVLSRLHEIENFKPHCWEYPRVK